MSLIKVTPLLANNETQKDAFPNVLKIKIAQITLEKCCSNTICERGFSPQTKIKEKWHNWLEIQNLDVLKKIAIEGSDYFEFSNTMEIRKL